MNKQQFKESMSKVGCVVREHLDILHIHSKGLVKNDDITQIPKNVIFEDCGDGNDIQFISLESISDDVVFANGGYVDVPNVTSMGNTGVEFLNKGHINLNQLERCGAVSFNNAGDLSLNSLKKYSNKTWFCNEGDIYLNELMSLETNNRFDNNGNVYLGDDIVGEHVYMKDKINFLEMERYTMLVEHQRILDDVTVYKCRIFGGGDIEKLPRCYVVGDAAGNYARGNTIREAIIDLDYDVFMKSKYAPTEGEDVRDVILSDIKKTKYITMAQYRILTGSCKSGCREFFKSIGVKEDVIGFPIDEMIEIQTNHRSLIQSMTKHDELDFLEIIGELNE